MPTSAEVRQQQQSTCLRANERSGQQRLYMTEWVQCLGFQVKVMNARADHCHPAPLGELYYIELHYIRNEYEYFRTGVQH